jgi:hypothetical protein
MQFGAIHLITLSLSGVSGERIGTTQSLLLTKLYAMFASDTTNLFREGEVTILGSGRDLTHKVLIYIGYDTILEILTIKKC